MKLDKKTLDRFWSKVDKTSNPNGCWEFSITEKAGYGCFSIKGKKYKAHRISYKLYYGKIPNGLNILHHCDNKKCINPDHLFAGTQQDNIKDMVNKNRHAKGKYLSKKIKERKRKHPEDTFYGEQSPNAKLTNEQANQIRQEYIPRLISLNYLAKKYNVAKCTILKIIQNKTYIK